MQNFQDRASKQMVDLSDEEFFDMGMYNIDKDTILNPNSKLKNLFGGLHQMGDEDEAAARLKLKTPESSHKDALSRYDFSQSSDQEVYHDDRPFVNMFSQNTNLQFASKSVSPQRKPGSNTK